MTIDEVFDAMSLLEKYSEDDVSEREETLPRISLVEGEIARRFPGQKLAPYRDRKQEPTADLESDAPLRPDEEVYGVTYEDIDNFLEGKALAETARLRILNTYRASGHKRALPVTPIHQVEMKWRSPSLRWAP